MAREQVNMLINLAASDASIAEKESRFIHMVGQANGLSKEEIDDMIENPEPIGELNAFSEDQKFEYLYNVIQVMKADGQVFKAEIEFCKDIAAKLGYDRKVVAELSSRIYSNHAITADRDMLKAKAKKYLKG